MHTKTARPRPDFETKTLRQPDDRDRKQCEDIPIAQGVIDRLFPAHLQAGFGARDVKLAGEWEAQQGLDVTARNDPVVHLQHIEGAR